MDIAAAILLLSELPGVGERTLAEVFRRCAVRRISPADLLGLQPPDLVDLGFSASSSEALKAVSPEMRRAAEATSRSLLVEGVRIITPQDSSYPRRLLDRLKDPPVLFAYGALDLLAGRSFAVANSNGAREEALGMSDVAAEQLVQAGWRTVTGHNRPAYQRTALAALRFGGAVCYVLDRGLLEAFGNDLRRELFPAAHVWSRAYDVETTLTLTPFPLRAHGIAVHNQRRDELVFALADTILMGEVRHGGQMDRWVKTALEQKRTVCLVGPPSETDDELLAAGAIRGQPQK
jgi:predicted Rossmann fold nucleotide-binding protein DprA/Smf involved in DNA uptake